MWSYNSIRLRLVAVATVIVIGMMIVTGFGLTMLLERNVERREGQELDAHLQQIIGGLRFQTDGTVKLSRDLTDPRFGQVFGGLYFQVARLDGDIILKSRSLWDTVLSLPEDTVDPGEVHIHSRPGPNNTTLLIHESRVAFVDRGQEMPLLVSVGIDKSEIIALKSGFTRDLIPTLSLLAVALLMGFAFQIGVGMRPLDRIRKGVANVKSGEAQRLPTDAPSEVAPLIQEVNSLLDQQDDSMARARDRAADLAHGLKTPLTALGTDIERLRKIGAEDIADDIQELSVRMRRHLDRELALARDRHGRKNARTTVKPALESIIRTLAKTPKGEVLKFQSTVPEWVELAVEQGDFLEVVGNLLENATKFAKDTISIECGVRDGWASIIINDDGPGVTDSKIAHIATRGVRLDMAGTGAGLGLAIVKDIVEANGGHLHLENRTGRGLSVTVTFRAASTINSKEKE